MSALVLTGGVVNALTFAALAGLHVPKMTPEEADEVFARLFNQAIAATPSGAIEQIRLELEIVREQRHRRLQAQAEALA